VNPYIGGTTEGLRGSATPKDLEYLFRWHTLILRIWI
jgi:zinc protease